MDPKIANDPSRVPRRSASGAGRHRYSSCVRSASDPRGFNLDDVAARNCIRPSVTFKVSGHVTLMVWGVQTDFKPFSGPASRTRRRRGGCHTTLGEATGRGCSATELVDLGLPSRLCIPGGQRSGARSCESRTAAAAQGSGCHDQSPKPARRRLTTPRCFLPAIRRSRDVRGG
jgi:hypothetical protein